MIALLRDLWMFMRVRKKFWLAPIVLLLVLLGLVRTFVSSGSPVAPFTYSLF
jgi:hypothetical protein